MEIRDYLKRIHYEGSLEPTLETLRGLHEAHMLTVPFENLDIHLGRKIQLDEATILNKIIEQRRGGFCYELNGAFAWLLRSLGFQLNMLSAGVANRRTGFGPEYDHMTLLVHLDEDWLADVGFGDSFRQPLLKQNALAQPQDSGTYRLQRKQIYWIVQREEQEWKPQYRFTLQPHELGDYEEMCEYQQTSPNSHFTRQRVCTIATPDGRVTLSDQRLITTTHGKKTERELSDQKEYDAALAEYFGVVL